MAETSKSLFYNSENGDRLYDADSFEHWLKRFFTSGVFAGCCRVTAEGDGMTCSMSGGYANADGKVRLFDETVELALQNAHATYNRIDTIVVERNDIDREITAKVVTGTYSANPTPTAPIRSGGIYQLVVAQIYVAAGATRVTQANITDKRPDASVCGYVMCAVETPDFSELYAQFTAQASEFMEQSETDMAAWTAGFESDARSWQNGFEQAAAAWKSGFEDDMEAWETSFEGNAQGWYQVRTAEFAAWFQNLQDQLDDNQAAHLQSEIDDITSAFRKIGLAIVNGQFYIDPVEYIE